MERDFPINHPAACDYDGTPYHPPLAPYAEDFAEGDPARGGKNIAVLDTPDGFRAALLNQSQDLIELASTGSLPPLLHPEKLTPIDLDPEELAAIYSLRNGLVAEAESGAVRDQMILVLCDHGYTQEQSAALIDSYCVPVSQK